jgi:arylesterase / paraoxonase
LIGGAVVAAVVLGAVAELAWYAGLFTAVENAFPGRCAAVPLGGSSEDIQVDRVRGIAYLSVLDRAKVNRGEAQSGTVMLLDLNLAEPAPRAALAYDPPGFRPHGLSLLQRSGMPTRLFAVSHRPDGSHTVEILEERGGQFFPEATIRDAAFVHPNALAATGPGQFYLLNDTADPERPAREFLLRRGTGTLYYYDGSGARLVAAGLGFPAGIALSPDTSRLYVGEALRKSLRIYARDPLSGALELLEEVALGTAPDNLNVDDDGVVWIAAHPQPFAFARHMRHPGERAPTQVLRFDPRGGRPEGGEADTRLTQVYENTGAEISAGSVAARWREEFLIGAVLDPEVLICRPVP